MLKVLKYKETCDMACSLLLGAFDGLHAGHLSLLRAAKADGLPVIILSIAGGKGKSLFLPKERRTIYERAGIYAAVEIPFSEEVQSTSAEEFLQTLFSTLTVSSLWCGEDFRFGRDATGDSLLLKRLSSRPVHVLPVQMWQGGKISTSRIKEFLSAGDMPSVNALLSGGYFVEGIVEHGRSVGRKYGFPTANIDFPDEKFPLRDGVYAGYVETDSGRFSSIMNFGARPTFGVSERKAEAYLADFSKDIYGEQVRLFPTKFLRPVQKFNSAAALKEQLIKDKESLIYVP